MPILAWIGNLIFTFALSNIKVISKIMTINFAIFAAMVAAAIYALTELITTATATLSDLVVENIPIVPYFIPSNFYTCLSAYITVQFACLTYAITMNWLANKAYIFKA